MYQNNMQDFIDKINSYIQGRYDFTVELGEWSIDGKNGKVESGLCILIPEDISVNVADISDSEDFEDQIINYVNNYINGTFERVDTIIENPPIQQKEGIKMRTWSAEELKNYLNLLEKYD